jgi:hypothetical protein
MAAVRFVSGPSINIAGANRHVSALLRAPADRDTWDTGLTEIGYVQATFSGASAAADSVSVSVSGGVITFNVIGTARDLYVLASGR